MAMGREGDVRVPPSGNLGMTPGRAREGLMTLLVRPVEKKGSNLILISHRNI